MLKHNNNMSCNGTKRKIPLGDHPAVLCDTSNYRILVLLFFNRVGILWNKIILSISVHNIMILNFTKKY